MHRAHAGSSPFACWTVDSIAFNTRPWGLGVRATQGWRGILDSMLSCPKKEGLPWNFQESETHFTVLSYWAFRMAVIAIILFWPDWCTNLNQEWSFPGRKEGKKGPREHLKYETITSWWAVWRGEKSCCRRYCTEQAFYENGCLRYLGMLSQWGKWLGGLEPWCVGLILGTFVKVLSAKFGSREDKSSKSPVRRGLGGLYCF